MLVTLIKYCNGPCHASPKIVTDPVTLYFLACGNDNNGNGRCNGIFSNVTIGVTVTVTNNVTIVFFKNTVTYSIVRCVSVRCGAVRFGGVRCVSVRCGAVLSR